MQLKSTYSRLLGLGSVINPKQQVQSDAVLQGYSRTKFTLQQKSATSCTEAILGISDLLNTTGIDAMISTVSFLAIDLQ